LASTSTRVFIIVRAPNGDVREVPIGTTAVVIGRDESADIRVEDKKVSRRHASFKLIDGEPWVEDLGSANGVKINGKRINKRQKIVGDDKVKVGGYQVTLRDLSENTGATNAKDDPRATNERARAKSSNVGADLSDGISRDEVTPNRTQALGAVAVKSKKGPTLPDDGRSPVLEAIDEPVKGERFVLHSGENIIGRLEECDIPVLDGSVSRQHARVVYARDRVSVSDLGSSNGTFVNDTRVEMAELTNGDSLRVGNIRFKVELPPELSVQKSSPVKTRARQSKEATGGARPFAALGIVILAMAIAVLGVAVWWKSKNRSTAENVAAVADGGTEIALVDPVLADSGEPERTIEAVDPVDPGVRVDAGIPKKAVKETPDAGVAEVVPPDGPETPEAPVQVATSTTPFGPRDASGFPTALPKVDSTFDFDGFVSEKLAAAVTFEKDGEMVKLREVVNELLARDPINSVARGMLARLVLTETAQGAMAKANDFYAKGEYARALKLYSSVPEGAPQALEARAKIEELSTKAIDQELERAEKDLKDKKTWLRAHRRFKDVLELDANSERALAGVRSVERRMRSARVRFAAWVPPGRDGAQVKQETPEQIDQQIAAFHDGDEQLARIAQLYLQGAMEKAMKRAEAAEKRTDGPRKNAVKKLKAALAKIKQQAELAKNETANDPNVAAGKLAGLVQAEEVLLPKNVKSVVRKDLEESIAEAFARSGSSWFDRGRHTEAFERWNAGVQLDEKNPIILSGLKKLEEVAKKDLEEAELAAQRGERDACNRLREVSKITQKDSEVYRRALDRARQICG
jgi:pSer/pThr/pTyr-binding forkhead associated (FHA) protein